MDIRELIPKDKFDIDTAKKLPNYSYDELKPIIPDLLTWIQDMNWPVSHPVADYLITISEHITDDIISILNSKDTMWQYWTLCVFGQSNVNPLNLKIVEVVKRIATKPTATELADGVHEIANEVLAEQKDL